MNATVPHRDEPAGTEALRARLAALRDRLRADVGRVAALRAVAERRAELDRLLTDLDRQLERVQRAAVITLVGATGAGKSTLLNALVGKPIAIEGMDRPTTRRPVIYAPRDADLSALIDPAVERPEGHESEGGPVVVRYDTDGGPWTAQILVDAPDMNSIDEQHRATVTALAERSDVLVVVVHHQSIVEAASVSFVDAFAGRRRLIFVLNRADELTPEARAALLAQVREMAATRWQAPEAPVVCLSARRAQTEPNAEGWAALCQALRALVRESAIAGVRRLNALGAAARIEALFDAVHRATAADLAALPDAVAGGLQQLGRRSSSEVTTRLGLRRADLAAALCDETAKRWDGPGGWALRAGTVGSLGVAAALLMRRSPLIGAGTAAGSLAAERVQRAWRERRVSDAEALVPSGTDFTAWYAEALSPARVAAARLTGDPDLLGVPPVGALHEQVATAVGDAWSGLLDRDLPAAAERSWLRFARLPLDLPVYGLAGWVIYQVATGFFAGRYAGVDFLVNAALLLLAYLAAVRLVVRSGLAARARRLLADVTARAAGALAAPAESAATAVREACVEHTATLDRLRHLAASWRRELE